MHCVKPSSSCVSPLLSHCYHTQPFWHQRCGENQLVSYNSAQSDSTYLEIVLDPKGQPLSLTRLPPSPLQMPITSPGCPLCFCLISCKSEVPTTSLDSVDLLERLTELRKTVCQFLLKGCVKGHRRTSRWKRCVGKVREWAQSFHHAFSSHCLHQPGSSLSPFGICHERLHL